MKLESIVGIGGIVLVVLAAITYRTEPTVVGSGVEAQLRTEIDSLKSQLSKATDDLRAVRMEKDRLLVKQPIPQVTPQVRQPARSAAPPAVRLPAGGAWVDRPVYGPLGRQRGTERVWVQNKAAVYRSNCANGVCR